ncbi:MAG: response regulator [Croceibacterium sp.]
MTFILIIDSNERHASRASEVLTSAGHACGHVASAEQAIALLRWRVPDLILLDQAIPGADGGTLPHRLRRLAGEADLPIILVVSDSAASRFDPMSQSVLEEIRKPFDPGFLVWRVNYTLEARISRQPADAPLRSLT